MKNLVILGAGTAGTMMANHLVKKLPKNEWQITIIDQYKTHYYQPGFLFLPFDIYTEDQVKKVGKKFIPKGVNYIQKKIELISPEANKVTLENEEIINYDLLIVATGSKIAPDEIEGMKGPEWHKSIFDFYSYEGAKALRDKLRSWEGGKLVVHITEMPIKCPVAPLEFAFLADSYFRNKGMRDKVDITYVTPLDGAFTKPKATKALHHLLVEKGISEVTNFNIERVDYENNKIIDYAETEVDYDLLVTVPTNMGDALIERSGMGDDLNFIPTDKNTLQSKDYENVFVIGDATNLPTSKAGSVAHFEAEILEENILKYIKGEPLDASFDGHANCFVETGNGKALLIDFNYVQEPVEGTFPIAGIGPMQLLKENRMNHMGKLAFRWVYWNMLLKGVPIPFVSANMSTKGKKIEA
ncbi:type III sulfide quinone reductase, selenoprotein subtype [Winogradskyella aquimaris]|uniref:FAD/NAD(P)-binding oxidoreductase n=1 Tax=Winogradskyella aquimaris TaxID=864074 RepID=A0ABU5EK75_9FLAO|nr:FAD/NAD(P)-binding oxidoreductase [Winogradskyella aquimaris]MDY2586779.1 FAD/NAD(P)-binding oxidoreductase [Winogradskyella aquimaris]